MLPWLRASSHFQLGSSRIMPLPDDLLHQIRVPNKLVSEKFWQQANLYHFVYSLGGLVLGFTSIIGGIALFLHGVTGTTSWTAKILGASSQISDAAPGAVLFIVGLFIIYVTRFSVETGKP
jgi:hypothetical protein